MDSFASKSSLTHRNFRYLAACLASGAALVCAACASDDSEDAEPEDSDSEAIESKDSEKKAEDKKETAEPADTAQHKELTDEEFAAEFSPEAQAKRAEEANPGIGAVMKYDGNWKGTTSQDQPVSFKILNRFIGHLEIGYQLEGDDCDAEASAVKFSAMLGARGGMFMYTTTVADQKLVINGMFPANDKSEGEFTVELTSDAPEGCNKSVSGTWKASK